MESQWIVAALERFEQPLLRYTHRLVRDPDQAREIVQDAFLKLCRSDRQSVEGHVREWLYAVCRNSAIDWLRRVRPSVPLEDGVQESSLVRLYAGTPESPSKVVERRIQTSRILALIADLTEDQQEVIRLKFQEGLSYAEISRITGHSVSNVGVLIHSGLKKAKKLLAEQREGSYGG
jgi:RNA polymerase sigma-70 factor (ECF subfamily)